ncbi:unnamed protein product [Nesidiocoris tenuis]|uniref:NAB co-repressor domain-containing protein n=1 Tax=Nesidiocoris tenuis TaxID=355587 RepID=A0A6H5G8L7_9HEMI|nr:unnamed protein product [Nesidiocoris tenuis]
MKREGKNPPHHQNYSLSFSYLSVSLQGGPKGKIILASEREQENLRGPIRNSPNVKAMFRSPLVPGGAFSSSGRPLAPLVVSPTPPNVSPNGAATCPISSSAPPPLPHVSLAAAPKDTPPPPPRSTSPVMVDSGCPSGSPGGPSSGGPSPGPPGSPLAPPPVLLESQVAKLAEAAQHLVTTLPQMEPKSHTAKKKMNRDLEQVLSMAEDDPRRMELVRKFAAIYGRFDCKRKPEKPLTLHEVSVNEAAAQICRYMPALLTRRDELFPLARQVVRDSGYHYSKGHSKSFSSRSTQNGDHPLSKRPRYDYSPESEEVVRKRQERLDQIADELRSVNERTLGLKGGDCQAEALQSRQQALLVEQTQLVNQGLQPNRYPPVSDRPDGGSTPCRSDVARADFTALRSACRMLRHSANGLNRVIPSSDAADSVIPTTVRSNDVVSSAVRSNDVVSSAVKSNSVVPSAARSNSVVSSAAKSTSAESNSLDLTFSANPDGECRTTLGSAIRASLDSTCQAEVVKSSNGDSVICLD